MQKSFFHLEILNLSRERSCKSTGHICSFEGDVDTAQTLDLTQLPESAMLTMLGSGGYTEEDSKEA